MAGKKIFVSYDYDNDRHYRYLLSAWDANQNFSFAFDDHSTPLINSTNAGRVKAAIGAKMAGADCLLVIVGEHTATSQWVSWEIEKGKLLKLGLLAVKIDNQYTTPLGLIGVGAKWAMSFSEPSITAAVQQC